jgi:hypothetical protein
VRKGNNTDVLARRKCTGARANREARRRESWARDAKSDNAALGPTGRQVGSARGRVLLARRGPGRAGSGSADWNGGGPGAAGGNITMRPVTGVGGGQPNIRPGPAQPHRPPGETPKGRSIGPEARMPPEEPGRPGRLRLTALSSPAPRAGPGRGQWQGRRPSH